MKKTIYSLLLISLQFACSNDDDSSNTLNINYDQSIVEITFRQAGETTAPQINWFGNEGTFSATTLTMPGDDDLVGRVIFIDKLTGVISWDNRVPLGEKDIIITAVNATQTATERITLINNFKNGLFIGGFNTDTSDEPDFSGIINDTSMVLSEDGTADLIASDGSNFEGVGNWTADGSTVIVNFSTNESPPKEIVMVGFMFASSGGFEGRWGTGLNEDNEVENVMGLFSFEND
ncbi:hypothetical protein [Aquimarina litoralis]|uniref:hypothetical protein n=1 Tax=Aquimarina litoralis TaxID=584605 RepID=UPI001C59500B|nr:hypothetical protein [Aquimarina litoralis]MBW1298883.1 hypothetical protein [Aquimarina litoralis]